MQIRRQRMDDGKLRALLTAVDCGSFSKAAAQLGYTQSAMTHLVNKLEAEIGCTLLERDSQGIRLTDAGRQLLPYIQNVVCACDTLLQEAAEQSDPRKRTLRFGCFASIARARLPELLRAFRAEHPEIQLDVLVRSEELTTALASGRIQLALVDEARAKGFDFQPLADAPLVAAAAVNIGRRMHSVVFLTVAVNVSATGIIRTAADVSFQIIGEPIDTGDFETGSGSKRLRQ